MTKIIAIIVNYKSEERTRTYVQNQLAKIVAEHEIIIVDNGSTKESYARLNEDLASEHCHILQSEENIGFARANNLAVEYAVEILPSLEDVYFLFTNNDIRFLNPDVVEKMATKLQSLPQAGIIGPKVIGLDGHLQSPEPYMNFWDRHIWIYWSNLFYSKEKKKRRFRTDYAEKAEEGYHYRVMGSFFMTRAKDYLDCGMMDSNTFLFAEEQILSERMNKIGKKVYYYPEVAVIHEHGQTIKEYFSMVASREMKFVSDCYYYTTYRKTPNWQINLAKFTYWLKKKIGR